MTEPTQQPSPEAPQAVQAAARAPYAGPSPLSAAAGRGSFLGVVGYAIGRVIGDVGMPKPDTANYSKQGAYTVGGLLAITGAILGAYTAMRDAQAAARQHYAMQKLVNEKPQAQVEQPQDLGAVVVAEKTR